MNLVNCRNNIKGDLLFHFGVQYFDCHSLPWETNNKQEHSVHPCHKGADTRQDKPSLAKQIKVLWIKLAMYIYLFMWHMNI